MAIYLKWTKSSPIEIEELIDNHRVQYKTEAGKSSIVAIDNLVADGGREEIARAIETATLYKNNCIDGFKEVKSEASQTTLKSVLEYLRGE